MDNNNEYCFSIACPPSLSQKTIELHILYKENSQSSTLIFDQLYKQNIKIKLPYGNCCIENKPNFPIIFIAAGTGFAQIKCLIDYCINNKHEKNKWLYWGVETAEQLYMNIPKHWITNNVKYIPVVNKPVQDWNGKTGLIMDVIIKDFNKEDITKNTRVYISGSSAMVKNTSSKLKSNFLGLNHIYSDML